MVAASLAYFIIFMVMINLQSIVMVMMKSIDTFADLESDYYPQFSRLF